MIWFFVEDDSVIDRMAATRVLVTGTSIIIACLNRALRIVFG